MLADAATTAVGCPAATSAAKLGPDSATTGRPFSSCSATSVMSASVSRSIPFVATTIVASAPTPASDARATPRSTCDGVTNSTSSLPRAAAAASFVAATDACSGTPRRKRVFSWRLLTLSTTSASCAQSAVS